MQRVVAVGLTVGAVAWTAAVILAPLAAAAGVASPLVALMYEAAGLVCHQRPARSFQLSGVALPVCARCVGLYASAAAGSVVAWAGAVSSTRVVSRRARLLLAIAALPTAVTVLIEWLGLAHLSSVARALWALPLGAVAGWLFVRMLREEEMDAL